VRSLFLFHLKPANAFISDANKEFNRYLYCNKRKPNKVIEHLKTSVRDKNHTIRITIFCR
jgi:hypothetical protein